MALDVRHQELVKQGDKLFADKAPLNSLLQETADHFYPERAHFTQSVMLGREFAAHLTTSYPLICRRDLGNAFSSMLRPKGKQWFSIRSAYTEDDDASKQWLQYAAKVQRAAMYDRASLFTRATKEGDHDFAAFGQTVLSVELNRARDALLYRCWHLRDVAWAENAEGKIGCVHRNWEPTLKQLHGTFGDKGLAGPMVNELRLNPFRTVRVRHVVLESSDYAEPTGGKKWRTPYVSIYIDVENGHLIEEKGIHGRYYVIPRWQTVSGSQYAFSPATVAALPDARLIQAMTLTLLQAGEKAADPPMVAQQAVIRSDINLASGGVTWVDREYDERFGKALSPIEFDRTGLQFGLQMQADTRAMIREAFYLDKLSLPPSDQSKPYTATEATYRVSEYIRQALPLFEPMEEDYNGQLCDETFSLLMRNGAFGPANDVPERLRGANVQFHFESPLLKAEGAERGSIFANGAELLKVAAEADPGVIDTVDAPIALRGALEGIGYPAAWLRTPDAMAQRAQAREAKQAIAETIAGIGQAGMAAEAAGKGAQALGLMEQAKAA